MKLFLFILFFSTILLQAEDKRTMGIIDFQSKVNNSKLLDVLNQTLRSEILRLNLFYITDKKTQELVLKEQLEISKSDCFDDSCRVEIGQLLSVQLTLVPDIIKVDTDYKVSIKLRDIEKGINVINISEYFPHDIGIRSLDSRFKSFVYKMIKTELFFINEMQRLGLKKENIKVSSLDGVDIEVLEENKFKKAKDNKVEVTFRSKPSGAEIFINNKTYGKGVTPLKVKIPKGIYVISLEKDAYNPLEKKIDISNSAKYNFKLKSGLADIKLETKPIGAKVYNKGNFMGLTPLSLKLKTGLHKFTFKKSEYKDLSKTIKVTDSDLYSFDMESDLSIITISSKPLGAKVYIDKKKMGLSPLRVKLLGGKHKLKLVKKNYKTKKESIFVDGVKRLKFDLKYDLYNLLLDSDIKGAKVYINKTLKGKTPLMLKLNSGKYNILLKKNGFLDSKELVELVDRDKKLLVSLFKKEPVLVSFKGAKNTKLFLNDIYKGILPVDINLEKDEEYKVVYKNKNTPMKKKTDFMIFDGDSNYFLDMNYIIKFMDISLLVETYGLLFDYKDTSFISMIGLNLKLVNFTLKNFNISLFEFAYYYGTENYKILNFSLFDTSLKVYNNFYLNISLGPFLGNYMRVFNNNHLYFTYLGAKFFYKYNFSDKFYIKAHIGASFSGKNSESSSYSQSNKSTETGFIYNGGLSIGFEN